MTFKRARPFRGKDLVQLARNTLLAGLSTPSKFPWLRAAMMFPPSRIGGAAPDSPKAPLEDKLRRIYRFRMGAKTKYEIHRARLGLVSPLVPPPGLMKAWVQRVENGEEMCAALEELLKEATHTANLRKELVTASRKKAEELGLAATDRDAAQQLSGDPTVANAMRDAAFNNLFERTIVAMEGKKDAGNTTAIKFVMDRSTSSRTMTESKAVDVTEAWMQFGEDRGMKWGRLTSMMRAREFVSGEVRSASTSSDPLPVKKPLFGIGALMSDVPPVSPLIVTPNYPAKSGKIRL